MISLTRRLLITTILWLIVSESIAVNYYWIGGSGNWSDINHWATTSGGTVNHLQVPTPFDDVYFDANSFTATGQAVIVDAVNAVCHDLLRNKFLTRRISFR